MRVVTAGIVVVAMLIGVSAAWSWWWRDEHPSGIQDALTAMPVTTQRLAYTDWSDIRLNLRVLRGTEVSTMSTWLQTAFSQDLSPGSVIANAGPSMQAHLGFSPANIQWEAYGQSSEGQVEVLRMNGDADFTAIAATLKKSGFPEPSTPTGMWSGGPDVLAALDPSLSAELANIVLLPDKHMVLASSSPSYLSQAVAAAQGKQKSLNTVGTLTAMLGRVDDPTAAVVWVRDFACADLAMSQADTNAQAAARQAIAAAGQTSPLVGFMLALGDDGVLTAAEQFTSPAVAQGDLKARASLATGPEYGRSTANFSDDFTLESAETKNSTVLLRLKPKRPGTFPLSALYSGPLVFATC